METAAGCLGRLTYQFTQETGMNVNDASVNDLMSWTQKYLVQEHAKIRFSRIPKSVHDRDTNVVKGTLPSKKRKADEADGEIKRRQRKQQLPMPLPSAMNAVRLGTWQRIAQG